MPLICLHNKKEIEKLLEQDPYLNIYGLGDLDERFRPYTLWYGWTDNMSLAEIVCVYRGSETPTVLAFSKTPDRMLKLLNSIRTLLPGRFYAHLSPGLEEFFRPTHNFEMEKAHYKMALTKPELLDHIDSSPAVRLGAEDVPLLSELYMSSYPGNWFEPDKIGLNRYFGIKENGRLIGAAGTHVYSSEYRASAVGNITTRPAYRGRGYGTIVTAALSRLLLSENLRVGLNVQADNNAAIACYGKTGFTINAGFGEYTLSRKEDAPL